MIQPPRAHWARRIMIVEDEPQLREELGELFECRGFTVMSAGDATSALSMLRETAETLFLLTDFRLPGASGLDLVRNVRADPALDAKVRRIVMMTGHSELTELVDADLARFAINMLNKPVASDRLLALFAADAEVLAGC